MLISLAATRTDSECAKGGKFPKSVFRRLGIQIVDFLQQKQLCSVYLQAHELRKIQTHSLSCLNLHILIQSSMRSSDSLESWSKYTFSNDRSVNTDILSSEPITLQQLSLFRHGDDSLLKFKVNTSMERKKVEEISKVDWLLVPDGLVSLFQAAVHRKATGFRYPVKGWKMHLIMRPGSVRVGVQPEKTPPKGIRLMYRYFTFALPISFFFSDFPQSGIHGLAQAQVNYVPWTICGPLSFLMRPAELEEIILRENKS